MVVLFPCVISVQPLRLRRSETKKESFTGNIPEGFFKESLQGQFIEVEEFLRERPEVLLLFDANVGTRV